MIDLEAIAAEPYEHRGIPHSEMALIIHTCRRLKIEVVIESGRARGQSTYMLAKYLPECLIRSYEFRVGPDEEYAKQRLSTFKNVELDYGNAEDAIPRLCEKGVRFRTAVLLDGPKGAKAVRLLSRLFEHPLILVGFVHDMRMLDHGSLSPHRAYAVEQFPDAKFSDDPRLIDRTAWLDANVVAAGGPVGPEHEKEFGSYGPTVGVFFNTSSHKDKDNERLYEAEVPVGHQSLHLAE